MRASTIQFLTYAASMASYTFIPLLANELNASKFEVGIIVAVYGLAFLLSSYVFGRFADIHERELILRSGLIISAITFFMQIFIVDKITLLIIRILNGISIGIYPSALISHVHDRKKKIGRFSSYGSLGWAFGTFIAGIVTSYHGIFILSSFLFFIAFFLSFKLKMTHEKISVPFFPVKLIRKNFSVYLAFFFRYLGAMSIWAVFPLYLFSLGADKFWIAMLYVVNYLTQFIFMRISDKFKSEKIIYIGLALSTFVFFLYSLTKSYTEVIPIQILLGISWAFLYVGSLIYLMDRNVEKATSIGIFNSITALSSVVGPFFGGFISEVFSFRELMYFASILSAFGFFIFFRRYMKIVKINSVFS
ncbi:MAG: MFS transporter [Candidatus Altiarchaeota archaeon]